MRWEYFSTEYEDEDEAELKFILLRGWVCSQFEPSDFESFLVHLLLF